MLLTNHWQELLILRGTLRGVALMRLNKVEVIPLTRRIYGLKDWYFLMGERKTEENNYSVGFDGSVSPSLGLR